MIWSRQRRITGEQSLQPESLFIFPGYSMDRNRWLEILTLFGMQLLDPFNHIHSTDHFAESCKPLSVFIPFAAKVK